MFLGIAILLFLGDEFHQMTDFKGFYQRSSFTISNMTEIGIVKLEDMGTLPFFSVHYKGKQLPIKSEKYCNETKGDCFEYVQKYLDIKWINAN